MPRTTQTAAPADTAPANGTPEKESVSAYFRRVFSENPRFLEGRSNDELLKRWLEDHPGHAEVPDNVKGTMANIKSILRNQPKKRGRPKGSKNRSTPQPVAAAAAQPNQLDVLEQMIDECLGVARHLEDRRLGAVIEHLRQARNGVVLAGGR